MNLTQFLSIELGTECNLGKVHQRCPNQSPERYRHVDTSHRLDDPTIVSIVSRMYQEFGFRGLVAWHYYNEPLTEQSRMFALMERICSTVPEAKFLLWTNGTLIPDDLTPFDAFIHIVVTDYKRGNQQNIERLAETHKSTVVCHWPLDARLHQIAIQSNNRPCRRMFAEIVFDAYGNVHLCCYDWKGLASPGNIFTSSLGTLVMRWQKIRTIISEFKMHLDAPMTCLTCSTRSAVTPVLLPNSVFVPEVVEAIVRHYRGEQTGPPAQILPEGNPVAVAVVFPAYKKVPIERIQDHFRWNGETYEQANARVYVVTDRKHDLPDYVTCVIFPESELPVVDGKPRFSICKTKNAGIRRALADGAEVIIATDVDMVFPPATWQRMVSVGLNAAVVPTYVMATSYERRMQGKPDTGATGTVAMRAIRWQEVQYEERCVGYGSDDGIMVADIRRAGMRVIRESAVFHIEHPGAEAVANVPGHGRAGCYGRDGFNFDNFRENRKLFSMRERKQRRRRVR